MSSGRARGRKAAKPRRADDGVPDIFHEMLDEASSQAPSGGEANEPARPLKRRKIVAKDAALSQASSKPTPRTDQSEPLPRKNLSTKSAKPRHDSSIPVNAAVDDDSAARSDKQTGADESDTSEESEFEWEEVELQQSQGSDTDEGLAKSNIQGVEIVIGDHPPKQVEAKRVKRRGITATERKQRLDVHKLHLLCLLYHAYVRNKWCNDGKLQDSLKKLVSPKVITLLNPDPALSQFQASQNFMNGLHHINTLWREKFTIDAYGMTRPRWAAHREELQKFTLSDYADPPMTLENFRTLATSLSGSQDFGAQLFCALLRAVGVETRLVCSLQCLPFTAVAPVAAPKVKDNKKTIYLDAKGKPLKNQAEQPPPFQSSTAAPTRIKRISQIGRVGIGSSQNLDKGKAPDIRIPHSRPKIKPEHPVFWVEVFNYAHQKWVAVDPLATFTVDKPSKLEPPISSENNILSYAVSFEEDGTAKDVTRRYAKAYNAKTRKLRVENTEGGERWWSKALKVFRKHRPLDRDRLEDAALARKEAAEGFPRNVQDFKNHPLYVLERHLKHNEVVYPKTEVGKFGVGSSTANNLEPVYRRSNVHIVRSADRWYRMGREVKFGEQPLKYGAPRKGPEPSFAEREGSDEENATGVPLYAAYQTELYIPPPVVRGRIPKNAYGNLDVYVPSMIPAGGVHIRDREARQAAKILGIDYADAVTGFQFKGRQGSAVVEGCVVAAQYVDAVRAVIDGLAYMQEEATNTKKRIEALRLWKRFLIGLRIVERLKVYTDENEQEDVQKQLDDAERREELPSIEEGGGGFFMEDSTDIALPTAVKFAPNPEDVEEFEGGFIPDDDDEDDDYADASGNEAMNDYEDTNHTQASTQKAPLKDSSNEDAGGFITEDDSIEPKEPGKEVPTNESISFGSSLLNQTQGLIISPPSNRPKPSNIIYKGPGLGGGFIPDDSDDDVDMEHVPPPQLKAPFAPSSSTGVPLAGPSKTSILHETAVSKVKTPSMDDDVDNEQKISPDPKPVGDEILEISSKAEQDNENRAEASDDDNASLPSHDPEDEDAEPEWLLSELDD